MRNLCLIILCALLLPASPAHAKIYIGEIKIEEVNDAPYWQSIETPEDLIPDGRDVIVRIYRNWKDNPEIFEKLPIKIKSRRCTLDAPSAILAVVGSDQVYESIRQVIGDHIYGAYEKLDFELASYAPIPDKDSRWFFDDALGNQIPGATVKIFLCDYYSGRRILIGTFQTNGTLKKLVPSHKGMESFELIVATPQYGTAKVGFYQCDQSHFTMPLVDPNSEAGASAIWGNILDPENNPVEGAQIQYDYVRTLGEGLINPKSEVAHYAAITDQHGFFNMYMPPSNQYQDQRGFLIPLKSKYHVKITAPKPLGLLPYEGPLENGSQLKLILERPTGKKHLLIFKDEKGIITDPNKLSQIVLHIQRPDKTQINLTYDKFKDLDTFPYGTYVAELTPYPIPEPYNFKPLEVTENSPRELVFTLPDTLKYYGQVVHGTTGAAMPGAFVMLMQSEYNYGTLTSITDGQWQALHTLPADSDALQKAVSAQKIGMPGLPDRLSSFDKPGMPSKPLHMPGMRGDITALKTEKGPDTAQEALSALRNIYIFRRLIRTDSAGRFEIKVSPEKSFYGFVFFEKNYVPVMWPKFNFKPAADASVEIPPIRLFPAAKVFVEPHVDGNDVGIYPDWVVDERDNPDWTSALLTSSLKRGTWLKPNQVNTLYVPVGLRLKLKLSTPYAHQWCPVTFDQVIYLQHGQTLDLGKYTFKPTLQISAQVLSSAGEPLEGIPVRAVYDGHDTVAHNSDANGIVRFFVPPNSKGEFIVNCVDYAKARELLRQTTPFEVTAETLQFKIKISDEMLTLFSK
jgi:hypothetical protein